MGHIVQRRVYSLPQFEELFERPDGYYAIWKEGMMHSSELGLPKDITGNLYGFSGCIAYYSDQDGWSKYDDWFEEAKDEEVSVILIAEIPPIDAF